MTESTVLRNRFGFRVETLLARYGMMPVDLAAASKFPLRRIERILAGKYRRITIREMDVIANALGTSLHNLLAPVEPVDPDFGADGERSNGSVAGRGRGGRQDN